MAWELRPRLKKAAAKLLGDADEAEDAVQDTLLRLWEARDRLRDMRAAARTILRNCCLDRLKGRHPSVTLDDSHAPQERRQADDALEEADNRQWMLRQVERLPEAQRRMWKMRQQDGLDTMQTATMLGVEERTVRNAIAAARHTLAEQLRKRRK